MLFLFELERCIEYVLHGLNVHAVKEKLKHFVTILRRNCITDKCDVVEDFAHDL